MASRTDGAGSRSRRRLRGCRMVTTSLSARKLLANQLRHLDQVEWTVVSGDAYPDPPNGVEVRVVPIRREFALADVTSFVGLWRLLRRERYDFVQTHTPKASFLGLPAARLSGTYALYTMHGALYFSDNGRMANLLGWCFERWCCTWANRVLLQSREDERTLPAARICPSRKLSHVGNGIVLDDFLSEVAPASESDQPMVIMVSRLVVEKGCADFLSLARSLRGRARFVHVGPIEHDQSDALDEAEVAEVSKAGLVTFVGEVDDVRPWLAAADIVVLPSYREGIPRVAMEAAAMAKPVVAYDVRGVREVIDSGTGLLAPRGDLAALTEEVAALLDDPGRRSKLGEICRERVVAGFSEAGVLDRLREVYAAIDRGAA